MTAQASYHGDIHRLGILSRVQLTSVYWGTAWQSDSGLLANSQSLTTFYSMIVSSAYMDLMNEYSATYHGVGSLNYTTHVGQGTFRNHVIIPDTMSASPVTEAQIQAMLIDRINAGLLTPPITNNHLPNFGENYYVVHLPPGTPSQFAQQQNAAAYHFVFQLPRSPYPIWMSYAVVPFPGTRPTNQSEWDAALKNQTIYGSHELTEAVTNVRYGSASGYGYYDSATGREVGDLCEGPNLRYGLFNGFWIQAVWSNNSSLADHRLLPPGTSNISAIGNGQGVFPSLRSWSTG